MSKAGFVALLGRPNAGKSTLLNRIVGQKVAIVSDKPQTTRTRILGVKTYDTGQIVFVDTPGVHKPTHRLNVRMVDVAMDAMRDVDVLALVVDASTLAGPTGKPKRRPVAPTPAGDIPSLLGPGDRYMLSLLKEITAPVILVLNKVDLVDRSALLPMLDAYQQAHPFVEFVPISAADGVNVEVLESLFLKYLPEGEPMYPADYLTDQPERFFVGEIVREQVLRLTRDELPHSTAVVVDRFEEADAEGVLTFYCTILVERDSQKPIVIGRGGAMIREIGTAARQELMQHFDARVHLDLHVKVKAEWRNDERVLDSLGVHGHEA